jgi:hypothetical protein
MDQASSRIWRLSCLPIAWVVIGCAGAVQQKTPPPPGPTGTVAAFVTDAPANGVVSISLLVSGASLADSAGANTSIVSSTAQPEFRHLELAPTVMVQAPNIPTGSFSSLALTLANPQISISDSTGTVTQLSGSTIPSVKLTNSGLTLPVSLSVTANSLIGMQLDLDVAKSLSVDASGNYVINPVINVKVVTGTQSELDVVDTAGTISALSTNSFTVQLLPNAGTATVNTDSSTLWSNDIGQFANLQAGQTIEMNAEMQSSGSYLAKFIGSSTANLSTTYEGLLTEVSQDSSGNFSFNVAVQR